MKSKEKQNVIEKEVEAPNGKTAEFNENELAHVVGGGETGLRYHRVDLTDEELENPYTRNKLRPNEK